MSELNQYDYDLPRGLIAQFPLTNRTDARLLVARRKDQSISHHYIRDLPEILDSGDCLVVNDTKVIPARLVGRRTQTGGRWEGLFLKADDAGTWQVLSKTRGRLAAGETVTLEDTDARQRLRLRLLLKQDDGSWIVKPEADGAWNEVLQTVGHVPLPPYIREGNMTDADLHTYQTTYAEKPGAVAAPTAGLHFTPQLFEQLSAKKVNRAIVTLHVGLGTFRPVTADRLEDHQMHSEWGELTAATAEELNGTRTAGGRVIAVGTTSVRVLETAAADGQIAPFSGETNLFIRPPYRFQAVDGLLTNFHLPRTTLLVLVHTFGGDTLMKKAYQEAIAEEYRFYSYGDAMLIL